VLTEDVVAALDAFAGKVITQLAGQPPADPPPP
jgi:hypothetical protein